MACSKSPTCTPPFPSTAHLRLLVYTSLLVQLHYTGLAQLRPGKSVNKNGKSVLSASKAHSSLSVECTLATYYGQAGARALRPPFCPRTQVQMLLQTAAGQSSQPTTAHGLRLQSHAAKRIAAVLW